MRGASGSAWIRSKARRGPRLYLAMERLVGHSLEQRLRELGMRGETMAEAQCVDVGLAVCRSLAEAHKANLVHRDLKPANIMLAKLGDEDEPAVKVLDFGIARTEDSSMTAQGRVLGTPQYMSPEQCQAKPLDGRSDLYSLGVMLYRCAAGQLPFNDRNALALMYLHASEPPPDLQALAGGGLTDGFVDVVLTALEKQPVDGFGRRSRGGRSIPLDALGDRDSIAAAALQTATRAKTWGNGPKNKQRNAERLAPNARLLGASAAVWRPTALALWAVATPGQDRTVPAARSRVGRGRFAVPTAGANRRERAGGVQGAFGLVARAHASPCDGLRIPYRGRGPRAEPWPRAKDVSPAPGSHETCETDGGGLRPAPCATASSVFKEFCVGAGLGCVGTVLAGLGSAA